MKYLLAIVALLGMSSANAVVYNFEGVIDDASNVNDPFNATGIVLGSPFSGFFDYDPDALIPDPLNPDAPINGLRAYRFDLGSQRYFDRSELTKRTVVDGNDVTFSDANEVRVTRQLFVDHIVFDFFGVSGSPPSLDQFGGARFRMSFALTAPNGRFIGFNNAFGEITSFTRSSTVPEPGTCALFMLGLFGILLGRSSYRRTKRCA